MYEMKLVSCKDVKWRDEAVNLVFGDAQVKMVTADDDMVTDITLEGDAEEVDRMVRQLGLQEKGKVYVKGLLES